jgi:hypothetical protein
MRPHGLIILHHKAKKGGHLLFPHTGTGTGLAAKMLWDPLNAQDYQANSLTVTSPLHFE